MARLRRTDRNTIRLEENKVVPKKRKNRDASRLQLNKSTRKKNMLRSYEPGSGLILTLAIFLQRRVEEVIDLQSRQNRRFVAIPRYRGKLLLRNPTTLLLSLYSRDSTGKFTRGTQSKLNINNRLFPPLKKKTGRATSFMKK